MTAFRGPADNDITGMNNQPAAPFLLAELPDGAVDLIGHYGSTLCTPGACLLSAVCRSWRAAADRAVGWDIHLDLAAAYEVYIAPTNALDEPGVALMSSEEATAATPPVLQARRRLAAWLSNNRQRVSSLCIPQPPYSPMGMSRAWLYGSGWVQDLVHIRESLTGQQQQTPPASIALPARLVKLELPVLGLVDTSTFLKALRGCPSLQQLRLVPYIPSGIEVQEEVSCSVLIEALAPLKQLTTLYLQWPYQAQPPEECLDGLLRALPPSLVDVRLGGFGCWRSVSLPLSCFTHLVNLRMWDIPAVGEVEDDSRTSGGSSGGGSSSSSSGSSSTTTSCVASWTGMTELRMERRRLRAAEAQLQLPNLRLIQLRTAEPGAWQQLRGARHLEEARIYSDEPVETMGGLGHLTQLRRLLLRMGGEAELMVEALRARIGGLVQLSELNVQDWMVMEVGPAMLAPLTQLSKLTVYCCSPGGRELFAQDAPDWAANPAVSVVNAVAAAVAQGWSPLQTLVLKGSPAAVSEEMQQQVAAAAAAGIPGVEVVYDVMLCFLEKLE